MSLLVLPVASRPWMMALVMIPWAFGTFASNSAQQARLGHAAPLLAPALLAAEARRHDLTLVHFSSDYVYDGTVAEHREDEPVSPLGVYGR